MPTPSKRKPRKPALDPARTIAKLIGQPAALWDAVDAERGSMSRNEYVESALRLILPAKVVATLPERRKAGQPKKVR